MVLRSYGGADLPTVGQVSCRLSKGDLSVNTTLQVQARAPVDLLLGTDTLPRLGFSLTEGRSHTILGEEAALVTPVEASTEVKLIRPARLPAGHSKLVRVRVDTSGMAGETYLFEPAHTPCKGLLIPDALVDIGKQGETSYC